MSRRCCSFFSIIILLIAVTSAFAAPFVFTENRGQWDSRVRYQAQAGDGWTWYLTDESPVLKITVIDNITVNGKPQSDLSWDDTPPMFRARGQVLKFHFIQATGNRQQATGRGGSPRPLTVEGQDEFSWHNNYFYGNNPEKWAPDCRNYSRVVYRNVWSGVDVVFRITENRKVEFDCECASGSAIGQVRFRIEGLNETLSIDPATGDLLIPTSVGALRKLIPYSYQTVDSRTIPVPVKYRLDGNDVYGFELSDSYNPDLPLTIDPMVFGSYLGGTGDEVSTGMTHTTDGYLMTGYVTNDTFPTTTGALQRTYGGGLYDGYLTKCSNNGSTIAFCTYYGGSGVDQGRAIAVNPANGDIYLAGQTNSTNLPMGTTGAQPANGGGYDGSVVRLNAAGNQILGGSYNGGTGTDRIWTMAFTDSGNVAVGGVGATGFPVSAYATQPTFGGGNSDGIVGKFTSDLRTRIWSTYRGGNGVDQIWGVATAGDTIYAMGETSSTDIGMPMPAYQPMLRGIGSNSIGDAFLSKWLPNGAGNVIGTYFGGVRDEYARGGVVIDANHNIIIAGQTYSDTSFPHTRNAIQATSHGSSEAYIAKFNANFTTLIFSTLFGGDSTETVNNVTLGARAGEVCICGSTQSTARFPLYGNPYQITNYGVEDGFVYLLNTDYARPVYSSYLGSGAMDRITSVSNPVSSLITAYGYTASTDWVFHGFQTRYGRGNSDAFIIQLSYNDSTAVREARSSVRLPEKYSVAVSPNPWNNLTTISVSVPHQEPVKVYLTDLLGRRVQTIRTGIVPAGTHRYTLNGSNLSSGIYFLQLESATASTTIKTVLLH